MKYLWIVVMLLLCSCTTNTLDPAKLPSQPLYVFAGERAVPGYGNAEITAVDRTTLQPIGTRSFVTSYIHAAIFDGQHIWFGYAGDNDIDMHKVAKLTPDFTNEQQFDTCVEPTSVHQDGDALNSAVANAAVPGAIALKGFDASCFDGVYVTGDVSDADIERLNENRPSQQDESEMESDRSRLALPNAS